ncbi:MFS transporter [Lacticaseibacillus sp. GG6-2]
MSGLLMALIYLAFISLGLPDSLLGSGWPVMHVALGVPRGAAGIVSTLIAGSTIVSSLVSDRLTHKLGVGRVTLLSVFITAVALLGFSWSPTFWVLCLWAVPYGLGAGSVDAALNNFAAVHYSSRAMNWLHCCWGIGASISPFIMSAALTHQLNWTGGYRIVGGIQMGIVVILLATLNYWPKQPAAITVRASRPLSLAKTVRLRGVPMVMMAFASYCGFESMMGLWAATYLHSARGVAPAKAAMFASLYYLGITGGRLVSGIVADHLGDHNLIRGGSGLVGLGLVLMLWPGASTLALAGLMLVGFGCAPIYPAIIHSTPMSFGTEHSQAVIGVQMAAAYTGSTVMPPLFGLVTTWVAVAWLPWVLLVLLGGWLGSFEKMTRQVSTERAI